MEQLANDTPKDFEQNEQNEDTFLGKISVPAVGGILLVNAIYHGSVFAETTYDIAKNIVEKI